ncbi:MAG TPA: DNA double-strand break repair nuclease NurA [Chloroflexia bacterium]|nr:DNA double-strand break repair nuclease NurA [Chloroflexia bacterium]
MPYDHMEIARQIAATLAAAQAAQVGRADAARDAAEIYLGTAHAAWHDAVAAVRSKRLMGLPHTPLHEFVPGQPAAPDYTVVATDSSFVSPDKHRGAHCYLINVGRVMVHYGEEPEAELDSTPTHYIDPLVAGEDWMASGRHLQAKCALQELAELQRWAERFRADVALLDGSLMQLGLALAPDPEVHTLMDAYGALLAEFERLRVPVVGYISKPASQAVMHAARLLACRVAAETPAGLAAACEQRCTRAECADLWSLDDGGLFWELLENGYRSPVFQMRFPPGGRGASGFWTHTGFCYLATPYEVARLEFPLWIVEAGLLDRVQRILLSQCALGEGYPKVLTLAHNFAVLRSEDRESYFFLLERAGLIQPPSEKARGKRATGGRI